MIFETEDLILETDEELYKAYISLKAYIRLIRRPSVSAWMIKKIYVRKYVGRQGAAPL